MGDFFSGASEGLDTMAKLALKRREAQLEIGQLQKKHEWDLAKEERKATEDLLDDFLTDANKGMEGAIKNSDPEQYRFFAKKKEAVWKARGLDEYALPREEVAGPGLPEGIAGPPPPIEQIKAPMTSLEKKEAEAEITARHRTPEKPTIKTDDKGNLVYWDSEAKTFKQTGTKAKKDEKVSGLVLQPSSDGFYHIIDKINNTDRKTKVKVAPRAGALTPKEKKLKDLKADYQKQVGQYYSAQRGVGEYLPNTNRELVAATALQASETLAIQYVKAGGKPEDLGITAEGIKADFKAGKIPKKKAVKLLKELFGME